MDLEKENNLLKKKLERLEEKFKEILKTNKEYKLWINSKNLIDKETQSDNLEEKLDLEEYIETLEDNIFNKDKEIDELKLKLEDLNKLYMDKEMKSIIKIIDNINIDNKTTNNNSDDNNFNKEIDYLKKVNQDLTNKIEYFKLNNNLDNNASIITNNKKFSNKKIQTECLNHVNKQLLTLKELLTQYFEFQKNKEVKESLTILNIILEILGFNFEEKNYINKIVNNKNKFFNFF